MEIQFLNALAPMFVGSPLLILLLDLIVKSTVVLTAFFAADTLAGKWLNDSSRHLLWLNCFLCLALLPITPLLAGLFAGAPITENALLTLTVIAGTEAGIVATNWSALIYLVYLLPCLVLVTRLALAMPRLITIQRKATPVTDKAMLRRLSKVRQQLGISRPVVLQYSNRIQSPVSFGLLSPKVILPVQAESWAPPLLSDVLIHELSHIRRLDWLTTIFSYVVACVYWMNPLVWIALRKLNEESENCCDTAVLHSGRSSIDYAENLLQVARNCALSRSNSLLEQTMLDRKTLETRLTHIMENKCMTLGTDIKKFVIALFMISAGVLTILSLTSVVSAQTGNEPDADMLPLVHVTPQYPTVAARDGIEGWVQVMFTVSETGDVQDITLVEAEPPEIFNANAIRAAENFKFRPRVRDGQAVAVPGVQYVFRFKLQADTVTPE